MMHEHDLDLIAAIAEGQLSPDEQSAAETSLASCEACRADLQLQREALAVLRAAPPITMTDLERASMHRGVAAALSPTRQQPQKRSTIPWFQRLMPAMATAAALLVVVGIGSVLINGAGDSDTAADTTTTAADLMRAQVDEEMAEASDGADLGGAALDDAAEPTTTTATASAPTADRIRDFGAISGTELAEVADQLSSEGEESAPNDFSLSELRTLPIEPALECAEIALEAGPITAIGQATVDGDDVEIYQIEDVVNVYSSADCSLTASFE